MDNGIGIIALFCVLGIFFYAGFSIGSHYRAVLQNEAIERGYAQFCPSDGVWNWKDECVEK